MASTSKVSDVRSSYKKNADNVCRASKEAIKAEFNDKLRNIILQSTERTAFDKSKLWSKLYLNELMAEIQQEQHISKFRKDYKNKYEDEFEVGTSRYGGNQLLVKDQGLFKIFPAWQDIFDIIWPLHLQHHHPSPELMKHVVQDFHIIPNFAIELLNEVCSVCLGEDRPFARCAVHILQMHQLDNAFDRIMVYEELHTGFLHMVPMSHDTIDSEISLELLRLFMDYGPPKKLFIDDKIVETSIDQVKHLTQFAPFDIEIKHVQLNSAYMDRLKLLLFEWCMDNNSSSWAIACYVLKWQLNKNIYQTHRKSPFDQIFRCSDGKKYKGKKVDVTSLPSTSAAREVVTPIVPVIFECPEMILPIIEEGSVSSLAPVVEDKGTTSSDDETDEPEVYLEAVDESMEVEEVDPLAIN
ncbi:hypothetical protein B5X24_HaOG206493 [Helicoverpa armigera]|uniref:Uncharacterized protein n=1 Tax=Helicoverpa armigera TaxID=29058 RepID=A0A2W1BLX6_HELAM|nr:hypothetical protein B5X24_HaOG206493 [Helicoverpa armigera]